MTMRQVKVGAALIGLLMVIVGVLAFRLNRSVTVNRAAVEPPVSEIGRSGSDVGTRRVTLYFVSGDGTAFREETRQIKREPSTTEEAKRTLIELTKGPESRDLEPTIPRQAKLLNLFIDSFGTAYTDFNQGLRDGQLGGAQGELFTVFSIVNTLTSNFAQITRVRILVDGAEIPTLAGHVDTRTALHPQFIF